MAEWTGLVGAAAEAIVNVRVILSEFRSEFTHLSEFKRLVACPQSLGVYSSRNNGLCLDDILVVSLSAVA